jgi:pantothenate kinase
MHTHTAKQDAIEAIEQLPDNVSLDEIVYRLYVLSRVARACTMSKPAATSRARTRRVRSSGGEARMVIWTLRARADLKAMHDDIAKDSRRNARRVAHEIRRLAVALIAHVAIRRHWAAAPSAATRRAH